MRKNIGRKNGRIFETSRIMRIESLEERDLLSVGAAPPFVTLLSEFSDQLNASNVVEDEQPIDLSGMVAEADFSGVDHIESDIKDVGFSRVVADFWDNSQNDAFFADESDFARDDALSEEHLCFDETSDFLVLIDGEEESLTSPNGANSGGSGGDPGDPGDSGGNVIEVTYSGGGIESDGGWLVREGLDLVFVLTGSSSVSGAVVKAEISHGTTCVSDFSSTEDHLTMGERSSLSFYIVDNDLFSENDETFTVNLSVVSGDATLSRSSFSFTIAWRPEFISDADQGLQTEEWNVDQYRTYIDSDANIGDRLNFRYSGVSLHGGSLFSGLQYSLVSTGNNSDYPDPTNYFSIDSSAIIKLTQPAMQYVADVQNYLRRFAAPESYECTLTVRALNSSYGASGGEIYDEATVHITFAHWDVQRCFTEAFARATPSDGATITMLAHSLGLSVYEYENWLTYNPEAQVELFDGTVKLLSELYPNDRLASATLQNLSFHVPNTIYAAYCFDPNSKTNLG